MTDLDVRDALEALESEIPGFLAALIFDPGSGRILVSRIASSDYDVEEAGRMSREVVTLQAETIGSLAPGGALEAIVLVLDDRIHLIRLLTPTRFAAVAADRWRANVSLLRTAVARHAESLARPAPALSGEDGTRDRPRRWREARRCRDGEARMPSLMALSPTEAVREPRGSSREALIRRRLYGLLDWLGRKRPTGLVRVRAAGVEVGHIAASQGLVCLAFATDGTGAPDFAVPLASVEDLSELCAHAASARGSGATLSATLPTGAHKTAFRRALLAESGRGLIRIVERSAALDISLGVTATRDEYDPDLRLTPVEVFTGALASLFSSPEVLGRRVLEAVGDRGAAVLLLQPPGETERPYPIAQFGFAGSALREFVSLARLGSELGRLGTLSARLGAKTLIVTFMAKDERWHCVASERRLALLRAPADAIEESLARAQPYVNDPDSG